MLQKAENRRYGFEIENSELSRHAYAIEMNGFRLTQDSSVDTECVCDCNTCDHQCDCEHCNFNYYGDEHCGDGACGGNEMASPVLWKNLTDSQTELLERLSEKLGDYSKRDESAGMHIHVEARDITMHQAKNLMTIWQHFTEVIDRDADFRGRHANQYCRENNPRRLAHNSDKMLQINFRNVFSFDSYAEIVESYWMNRITNPSPYGEPTDTCKTTIEFRGFAPNFDSAIIEARTKLCRYLVEWVANDLPAYWLLKQKSFDGFWSELTN
jgi:hypothetical protein